MPLAAAPFASLASAGLAFALHATGFRHVIRPKPRVPIPV